MCSAGNGMRGWMGAAALGWLCWAAPVAATAGDVTAPGAVAIGVAETAGGERQREVYDVSLHDPQALQVLLDRLDTLAQAPNPQAQPADIALVLHGPELEYFAIGNYTRYSALVDLAAKLDAFQLVEVKACSTKMRALGLKPQDLPAFIEIVPFGPGEVERLLGEGYLKM